MGKDLNIKTLKRRINRLRSYKSYRLQPVPKECPVCNQLTCSDEEVPKVIWRVRPITRGYNVVMQFLSNFKVLEVYRCMPLIGGEEEIAPNWDVHIAQYAIVFVNSKSKLQQ